MNVAFTDDLHPTHDVWNPHARACNQAASAIARDFGCLKKKSLKLEDENEDDDDEGTVSIPAIASFLI